MITSRSRPFKTVAVAMMLVLFGAAMGRYAVPVFLAKLNRTDANSRRADPPTLDRLAELSELLTVKLEVADVLVIRVDGFTGGAQVALLVRGDVNLAVDLSQARFEQVDRDAHTALLVLPPPRPTSARLDHEQTRIVALSKDGLWIIAPTDRPYVAVVERALVEAQRRVEFAAEDLEAGRRARCHAETVLGAFFRMLGWEVAVRW